MIRSTGRIKIYKNFSSLEVVLPYLAEDFTPFEVKEGTESWEVMKNEERAESK
jgi:hypothetical protein